MSVGRFGVRPPAARQRLIAISGVALVALVPVACTGTSGPSPTTTTPNPTTSAASPAPTTSATPTTTPVLVVPQETPTLAATMLLDAWRAGDRAGALKVASAAAVATLFAQAPASYSDRGCQTGLDGRSFCAFGIRSGLVQILTVTSGGGWLVQSLTFDS